MVKYKFKWGEKLIEIYPNQTVADVKNALQKEFKFGPILAIHLIVEGKIIADSLKFTEVFLDPKKIIIKATLKENGIIFYPEII